MTRGNALFVERANIIPAFLPVDMSGSANTGDRVSMALYNRCTVVLIGAAGTAGDDPALTLLQADAATGGNSKALDFEVLHVKQAASLASSPGTFTRVEQAASNSYTDDESAEQQVVWAVDITADMLDLAGGFTFLQASVPDVGTNAQLGACFYILSEPRYTFDGVPGALA